MFDYMMAKLEIDRLREEVRKLSKRVEDLESFSKRASYVVDRHTPIK